MRCLISISSLVSSSNTALRIYIGTLHLAQFAVVRLSFVTCAHNSIASLVLDKKLVLLCVLCAGACDWFYLRLFLVEGGTHISDAVDNNCDHWRGCTLGGDVGSTLGGGTLLCIGGSTLVGVAGCSSQNKTFGLDNWRGTGNLYPILFAGKTYPGNIRHYFTIGGGEGFSVPVGTLGGAKGVTGGQNNNCGLGN